jgi:hypothetical protein
VKVLLSKRNAKRLARQRKVSFTLRMLVHAASATVPPTTVLTTFTLTH